MTYPEAIDWLFSTQMFGIKLGLDGPRNLLKRYLAYPAHGVKVIHVAGTNGKGSTSAMIDSLSRACGQRTGLFTSPHLIDYRERIQVSGQQIPEDRCAEMLTELRELCESLEHHPTFFEITLTLAMKWFRECECEVIVLETGMGGRLDATTAVPADVCVITPIGLDHTQWLGDTLEKITAEKAGIFVSGKPAISAPQDPAAHRVLEMEANEIRCPLTFVTEPLRGYAIGLAGEHQTWNAALAVSAVYQAGIPVSYESVHYALKNVRWPGRFERFSHKNHEVILDGAHNPQGAEALAQTWGTECPGVKPTLVFSAVTAKDIAGILQKIAPLAERIFICPVDTPRAVAPEDLAAQLPENAPPHEIFPTFSAAFDAATAQNAPVLIAGSLFLVGEARALLTESDFQASTQ
ncbi:MAG: folylpolyglutamate synthase/dihydrofolate synthase family protein [Luteolibacter sp.]